MIRILERWEFFHMFIYFLGTVCFVFSGYFLAGGLYLSTVIFYVMGTLALFLYYTNASQ